MLIALSIQCPKCKSYSDNVILGSYHVCKSCNAILIPQFDSNDNLLDVIDTSDTFRDTNFSRKGINWENVPTEILLDSRWSNPNEMIELLLQKNYSKGNEEIKNLEKEEQKERVIKTLTNDQVNLQKDEQILFIIHNALFETAPLNLAIGDIIWTNISFYFISYIDFLHNGSLGASTGVLLGGIVGGIASAQSDRDTIISAVESARVKRNTLYGFDLSERIKQNRHSIVINAKNIAEVKILGNKTLLSLSTKNGLHFQYNVPPLTTLMEDCINNWPKSSIVYDKLIDSEGFYTGNISLSELLSRILKGDLHAGSELYRLGQNEKYAISLVAKIQSMEKTERQQLLQLFSNAPNLFLKTIHAIAKKEVSSNLNKIIIGTIGGVAMSGIILFFLLISADSSASIIFLILIVMLLYIYSGQILNSYRIYSLAKEIRDSLVSIAMNRKEKLMVKKAS